MYKFLVGVSEEKPTLTVTSFFSSVQRDRSTFCALCTLPYVLSTSFSTHPKPLKAIPKQKDPPFHFFDTKRLSPFFGTMRLFKFLIFSRIFFIAPKVPPVNFLIFCNRMDVQNIPKGPPFTFFGSMMRDLPET